MKAPAPAAVGLLALALAGCAEVGGAEHGQAATEAATGPPASAPASARALPEELPGVVLRPRALVVASEAGRVVSVSAELGDTVAAGAPLLRLDTTQLRRELARARARRRQAEARVEATRARARHAHLNLDADRAIADTLSARTLRGSERELAEAEAAVEVASAELEAIAVELASLEQRIEAATLRAPVAGELAGVLPPLGAHVDPDRPLSSVVGEGPVRVRFAAEAPGPAEGAALRVGLEGTPGRRPARVIHRAPSVDPVAQLVLVEAELLVDAPELLTGQACVVETVEDSDAPSALHP